MGGVHSPAQMPVTGRCTSQMPRLEACRFTRQNTSFTGAGFVAPSSTGAKALAQSPLTGQASHAGERGVHTVAPSSIIAWFQSPGSGASAMASPASSQRRRSRALGSPCQRLSTRFTLPSSTGARAPKQMEAMAPAVERPMPGSATMSSKAWGKRPPCRSMICRAAACSSRARR